MGFLLARLGCSFSRTCGGGALGRALAWILLTFFKTERKMSMALILFVSV